MFTTYLATASDEKRTLTHLAPASTANAICYKNKEMCVCVCVCVCVYVNKKKMTHLAPASTADASTLSVCLWFTI